MLYRLIAVFTLVLTFSLAVWPADAKDADAMQGTWLAATAELGGKGLPEEFRKSIKMVIKDGKYTVNAGKAVDLGTLKLDPAAKPKKMDIVGTDGPNKGKTIPA